MMCVDNFGYADGKEQQRSEPKSKVEHEHCAIPSQDLFGLNMYHFMMTDGLPEGYVQHKELLEVGSGRGKGTSYVAQNFNPAKCTGIDLNTARVALANKTWAETPNLHFI